MNPTQPAPQGHTPRTDAAEPLYHQEGSNPSPWGYVPADFARTLERENQSLARRVGELEGTIQSCIDYAARTLNQGDKET